jgi:signal recognition particle GTPase
VFESLSDRLTSALSGLRAKGRLTDADIDATAREIRVALLEADVSLPVVRQFISRVKERARGSEVSGALNPAQQVIKIVNDELVGILGGETRHLAFAKTPPTVIMLAGLQGAGKTTLLNVLSSFISSRERIVTIEDAAELQLRQEHVARAAQVAGAILQGELRPEGLHLGDVVDVLQRRADALK